MSVEPAWDRVKEVFQSALERAPNARHEFLSEACGGDAALRAEVESLLRAHAGAGRFAEQPAVAETALRPDTSLGPYRILQKIGAGGMGEVYRAHDSTLGRDVALKVLPRTLSDDPDRIARLQREARVLAALNHPNIATIHGLESVPAETGRAVRALVLELVEGPTVAERLARGPLRLDEALRIALQIAVALAAAHDKGIIHRDLKPANIKLTASGSVKVLDFGLAKPVPAAPGAALTAPTTVEGVLAGTPAYMSPEQARGQDVDRRTDIWALGCVLYEMLTGRTAFHGNTTTDVLAHVIERNPDWAPLPATTPAAVRRVLRRCLEKDADRRFHDARDVRLDIEDVLRDSHDARAEAPARGRFPLWVCACVAAAALVAGIGTWTLKPSPPAVPRLVARSLLAMEPFDQRPLVGGQERRPSVGRPDRTAIALSPDGRLLVFRGIRDGGRAQLFTRPLDRLEATPIPGTEGADSPFFSPDGASIGFWAAGEIRRVPVTGGGPPTTIAQLPGTGPRRINGASWDDSGVILYTTGGSIWRVQASGGVPDLVTKPAEGERGHAHPHVLPGGQAILFTNRKADYRWDDAQIVVRSLQTGKQTVLLNDGADARYVSSGHLVFVRRGTLMAAPFDPARLALTGGAVALVDDVMQAINIGSMPAESGAGQFTIAAQGRMIYATGGITPDRERELVWVDRQGVSDPLGVPRREYLGPRLSPDGGRVLVSTRPSASGDGDRLWIYDLARRTLAPVTQQDEDRRLALWSPDGDVVSFQSVLPGRDVSIWVAADWTDRKIAFVEASPAGNDIWVLDTDAPDRRPEPVLQTKANEAFPAFSPDGRWLAYTSNESGRQEVYVRPYPRPGPSMLVSTEGGVMPAWRADGTELFYLNPAGTVMMTAPVKSTGAAFSAGTPRRLFEGRFVLSTPARGYDVTPDGRRFLLVRPVEPPPPAPIQLVLVENWTEELRHRAPRN